MSYVDSILKKQIHQLVMRGKNGAEQNGEKKVLKIEENKGQGDFKRVG